MKELNTKELQLLLKILIDSNKLSQSTIDKIKNQHGIFNDIKEVDLILDILSDELSSKGFNENDVPNSYGLQIEDLITFFSNLSIDITG